MKHRRRLMVVAGAVTCVFILGAASCATSQPFSGNGSPKLAFVGDSITVQSTDAINAHYGSTYDVKIDALVGAGVKLVAPWVAADATLTPDVEVINIGTNDAKAIEETNGDGETLADVTTALDTFNAEFPTSCVVFVTIDSQNPSWGPTAAAAINDYLRTTFPHVADWDAALVPADFDRADSPHPNETGRQALLAVEDTAIASCPTTTTTITASTTTTSTDPDTTTSTP